MNRLQKNSSDVSRGSQPRQTAGGTNFGVRRQNSGNQRVQVRLIGVQSLVPKINNSHWVTTEKVLLSGSKFGAIWWEHQKAIHSGSVFSPHRPNGADTGLAIQYSRFQNMYLYPASPTSPLIDGRQPHYNCSLNGSPMVKISNWNNSQ